MSEEQQYEELRFLTGTWHTVRIPVDKLEDPAYDPEAIYDAYWEFGGELPEGVEVDEDEVDHIWE